uniref:Uncharacterized protein n=1 Tax=Ditylenchus dipsaci TaxID=166011 RepID=A0A915E224_9BILA
MAARVVKDPFQPPKMYMSTYRAFVIGCDERFVDIACPVDEGVDYIQLHRTTPDETFCSKEHWGDHKN